MIFYHNLNYWIFQVKLIELEEKFNSKIKDVEFTYKNQIKTLGETNRSLQEQIEKLNKIVNNIEKEQVIIIKKDIIKSLLMDN